MSYDEIKRIVVLVVLPILLIFGTLLFILELNQGRNNEINEWQQDINELRNE